MSVQTTHIPITIEDERDRSVNEFLGLLGPQDCEVKHSDLNEVCGIKMTKDSNSSFGWMCSDFIIDENIPDFETKNLRTRFCDNCKVLQEYEQESETNNAKTIIENSLAKYCRGSLSNPVVESDILGYEEVKEYYEEIQNVEIEVKEKDPKGSFGWMCSDFIIDENIPDFEMKNLRTRFSNEPKLIQESEHKSETSKGETIIEDSTRYCRGSLWNSLEESAVFLNHEEEPKKYYKVKTNVEMAPIQSTQNTIEGPFGPDGKTLKDRLAIDYEKPPSGEKLATLVDPYTPKGRQLLSILHNPKYQQVLQEGKNASFTNFVDSRDFKFLLCNEDGIEEIVLEEILDYHSNKDENQLSLMAEIVLADKKCDIDDIVVKDGSMSNTALSDSGNAGSLSCSRGNSMLSDDTFNTSGKGMSEFGGSRSDLFRSIGLSDNFDKSLESYSGVCRKLRAQIAHMKDDFQHQEERVERLLRETRSFARDMDDVEILDDYINLMDSKTEKVRGSFEAFKIFNNPPDSTRCFMV